MVLPVLESSSKDTKPARDEEVLGVCSRPASLIIAHTVKPMSHTMQMKGLLWQCLSTSIYSQHPGRLFGCTARQFDYLRGWRHGAESEIFQMLIEKDSCSAVRQKWADKSFPESGRTAHSVMITIIIIL